MAFIKCKNCGGEIESSSHYCPKCGVERPKAEINEYLYGKLNFKNRLFQYSIVLMACFLMGVISGGIGIFVFLTHFISIDFTIKILFGLWCLFHIFEPLYCLYILENALSRSMVFGREIFIPFTFGTLIMGITSIHVFKYLLYNFYHIELTDKFNDLITLLAVISYLGGFAYSLYQEKYTFFHSKGYRIR